MTRNLVVAAVLAIGLPGGAALADYLYADANGTHTVFSFMCQATKLCTGFVLIDSTGTEKATAANPLRTDPIGTTTQPVAVTNQLALVPNTAVAAVPTLNVAQPYQQKLSKWSAECRCFLP